MIQELKRKAFEKDNELKQAQDLLMSKAKELEEVSYVIQSHKNELLESKRLIKELQQAQYILENKSVELEEKDSLIGNLEADLLESRKRSKNCRLI